MAYTAPTPTELKAVFAAFADVPDATVQYWLGRAALSVDESWAEADFAHARMLLAAHLMVLNGLGAGAEAEMAAAGAAGFKVMKSASLSLERFDPPSSRRAGLYDGTSYGRQFAALLAVNRGGPRLTNTGTVPLWPARYPHGEA